MTKNYIVTSPAVVFAIKSEEGRGEYSLIEGDTVKLPPEDITVRCLLKRGQIAEVPDKTPNKQS